MSRKKVWASTYQLSDGRWQAAKNVPMPGGKRRRITGTGTSQGEALARCEANYGRFLAETHGDPTKRPIVSHKPAEARLTFEQWFYQWHSGISPQKVTETVRRKYLRLGEMHLIPTLGSTPLVELRPEQLHDLIHKQLAARGDLSEGARSNIYKVLNIALTRAVKEERMLRNPLELVDRPHHVRKDERVEDKTSQAERLIGRLEGHPDRARHLLRFLGLRKSEMLGLTWDRIEFKKGEEKIVVQQQLSRYENGNGYYINNTMKTENSRRTIPLTEPWLSALRNELRRQTEWRGEPSWNPKRGLENLVFTTRTGGVITHNADNRDWHALLEANGIEYYRAHLNRHITASLLGARNVPQVLAKEILGHSAAMSEYYTQALTNRLHEPMASYGEHISKADSEERAKRAQRAEALRHLRLPGLAAETSGRRKLEKADEDR